MSLWRIVESLFFVAVVGLWAGGTAAAQEGAPGAPGGATTSPYQQQPMPGSEAGSEAAPAEEMPEAGAAVPLTFHDQVFLRKTLQNGRVQVEMARLAALKSRSDDVKQFGRKMALIHEQMINQLVPMAQRLGVWTPGNAPKKERETIAKMRTLTGPDFDAAFIEAMLKRQESDLKRLKNEEEDGHDATVQRVAKTQEPVVSQHLETLEQLAQSHNVPVAMNE